MRGSYIPREGGRGRGGEGGGKEEETCHKEKRRRCRYCTTVEREYKNIVIPIKRILF